MAKPPSSAKSVRLQDALWARLAAEAEKRGVKVNGLVVDLLEVGLLKAAERQFFREDSPQSYATLAPKPSAEPLKMPRAAYGQRLKKR